MATTSEPKRWADLGDWIAVRRRDLGMDQKELAEAAGVSENTIGNYERGRVPARGKMAPGYARVEKALHFAKGSFESILNGYNPKFAIEEGNEPQLVLRDPKDVEDPKARAIIPMLQEALNYKQLAMAFADLASRWNASDAAIDRFKDATENLLIDMISPGHGPAEVVKYLAELEAQGKATSDADRPELGWTALVADLSAAERLDTTGARLLKARTSRAMSREELSQASRVPERIIRMMESEDFSFPGAFLHAPVYIGLLCDALGVPSDPILSKFNEEHAPRGGGAKSQTKFEEWKNDGGLERAFPEAKERP